MDVKSVQALYEYNRWANAKVFQAVSSLTGDQFVKDLGSSYPSLRDTLTHIVCCEWGWLERWKGISPKSAWDPADFPSAKALAADGSRREPFHLPPRPSHHPASPGRGQTCRHRPARLL
jgi:uncharacterized damage-inducible protein DinB